MFDPSDDPTRCTRGKLQMFEDCRTRRRDGRLVRVVEVRIPYCRYQLEANRNLARHEWAVNNGPPLRCKPIVKKSECIKKECMFYRRGGS